ncbi:MAG: isoprenylcysteine carboxylmethyltransferase family protein [Ignavibacteriota bacterium]
MSFACVKPLVPICISLTMTAICLFASAGRMDWWNAWVLLGLSLLAGLAFTLGRDPGLAAERRNVQAAKGWDKLLVAITVLLGPMAVWITAGLDNRFHRSNSMPSSAFAAGVAVAVLAAALIAWAMRSNRFFSSVVRIQKDRGHTVVDRGPYQYIRHPGYAGMLLFTPRDTVDPRLLLGTRARNGKRIGSRNTHRHGRLHSAQRARWLCRLRAPGAVQAVAGHLVGHVYPRSYWVLAPVRASASVAVIRTAMEDLASRHYARRVRYRLPAIW